jgi:imidazoleglycerol-phosphate dehydratase
MTTNHRSASIRRKTSETSIHLDLNLDGSGQGDSQTGIGFFDHMLTAFSRHGLFDLRIRCDGDLEVDAHHTVEDVGICLGQAFDEALGDKAGIERFGASYVPMDEALARAVIDLSGRPYLAMNAVFQDPQVGEFPVTLVREFFRAVADHSRATLHLDLLRSTNDHHGIEAIFKACSRSLDAATRRSDRIQGIPSTKGSL